MSSCKYLGVLIDENLTWKEHIDYIYKKLVKFSAIFYKVRYLLPLACLKNLYFAFIYPHILFGVEVYANTYKSYLHKLSKLNNKLLRILLNKKLETPVPDLYRMLNVLPISDLHELQLLSLVHKCLFHQETLPEIFHDYFTGKHNIHNYNKRRLANLFVIRTNCNIGQRSSIVKGIALWN